MKLFDWLFHSKPAEYALPVPESVKPSDEEIDATLSDTFHGYTAAQHVNWAAEQIEEEAKYTAYSPITPKSMRVLYEGCRVYKYKEKQE